MRILVLDEEFPYPLNTGKRIRTYNLITNLARENEVTYLAYGESDSEAARALEQKGITVRAVRRPHQKKSGVWFYAKLFFNLFSRYPFIVTNHYSRRFQNEVNQLLGKGGVDVVIAEWTPYAIFIQQPNAVKKVIVAHNIESSIWRRYEENETNWLKKLYIMFQRSKVEIFEHHCYEWVDGATAVSAEEAEKIRTAAGDCPVTVIENGVDIDFFQPQSGPVDNNKIVFTGSMDWRPNQDAVQWFVRDIFPIIRDARPEAEITVVGRTPPPEIQVLGDVPGVTITGTVDDVRPYIAEAAVYVVPLRIGGGSRLKILEAMAMKKIVVSTSVGAEGLEVSDDETIYLADGAQPFADKVLALMQDAEGQAELAERARRLVEETYHWPKLSDKLNAYLRQLVSGQ